MTSRSTEPTEPIASVAHVRTNPRLLHRRVPPGMVVCVVGESVYQDVRVLRLDAAAAAVVEQARHPRAIDELAIAVARGVDEPVDGFAALVEGLTAARVLERVEP